MSRMHTKGWTPARAAKELARLASELGGGDEASLTVFSRFLELDGGRLTQRGGQSDGEAVLAEGNLWELLQRELDTGRRRRRGMFFTPRPLVRFIVRSVHELMERIDFRGEPHVIDPACGYGGFLIEAARQISCTRLTGIEVCEPTRAVAQMLCDRELSQPPKLIHVNPLLAGPSLRELILGTAEQPLVPLILGNPPWSNFGRQNRGAWIDRLLADYRAGLNERKSNLADDAIKFIRWAQYWIEQAGQGIAAFVTPNTWLAGLTHRRMRQSLLESFDEISVLDLHGESASSGDENVFGVRSGVAIVLFVKHRRERPPRHRTRCTVASIRGSRAEKFTAMARAEINGLTTICVHPAAPEWRLTPPASRHRGSSSRAAEYSTYWPLDRIFRQYTSGVQTKNDAVFVGFTREQAARQVQPWIVSHNDLPEFDAKNIQPYLLAPFDRRFVYYDPRVLGRARYAVMQHMLQPNLGLVFMRQSTNLGEYDHFLAADCLVSDRVFYSRHGAPFLAPLWVYKAPTSGRGESSNASDFGKASGFPVRAQSTLINGQGFEIESNFDPGFVAAVAAAIGELPVPRELFQCLYAIAHCPTYRERFGEELRRGFPRFPLPASGDAYARLCKLGGELVGLHLGNCLPEPREAGCLLAAPDREAFRIGGYDVLRRWAKPRQKRGLLAEGDRDLEWLAWVGRQTRRLTAEIGECSFFASPAAS